MEEKRIKATKKKISALKKSRHLLYRRMLSIKMQNELYKKKYQNKKDVEELGVAVKQIDKMIKYFESLI